MKQQLISMIANKLSDLGLPVQTGNGADIILAVEFLNAGWSTGNKKINYEASIFADERENVLYMYEKTSEKGQGISFGADSESYSQSGKTLFRKVKSVKYGPDGKAYEIDLDLGAIPKTVKDAAAQYGWKFKTVLNKKKAMYPEGYQPVAVVAPAASNAAPISDATDTASVTFCTNCGASQNVGSKFCSKCGNPLSSSAVIPEVKNDYQTQDASTPSQPVHTQDAKANIPIQPERMHTNADAYVNANANSNSNSNANSNANANVPHQIPQKSGRKIISTKISLIGYLSLTAVSLLFFWLAKVSIVGWGLGAAVLIASFLLSNKLAGKGCLSTIIAWGVTFVLLFVIFAMTSPDNPKGTSVEGSQVPNEAGGEESQEYINQGHMFSLNISGVSDYNYQAEIYSDNLELTGCIFDQLLIKESSDDPAGSKVKEIRIKNFKLTEGTKMGKFGGLEIDPALNAEFYPKVENGEVVYNIEEYSKKYSSWSASLCFRFIVKDVATYKYPQGYQGGLSIEESYKNAGIKSDDLRFGCSYDVEIINMSGEKFIKKVKVDPLQGDFLYDGAQSIFDTRVTDPAKGTPYNKN